MGHPVIELSMQFCGKILEDSFEKYKTFLRCTINEFVGKVDFKNRLFGWIHFENWLFVNCQITTTKNVNKIK